MFSVLGDDYILLFTCLLLNECRDNQCISQLHEYIIVRAVGLYIAIYITLASLELLSRGRCYNRNIMESTSELFSKKQVNLFQFSSCQNSKLVTNKFPL